MSKNVIASQSTARAATLDQLIETTLPLFVNPIPSKATLRIWFKRVPKLKANPAAKRGGGPCFYSVAGVEKFFRSRTIAT